MQLRNQNDFHSVYAPKALNIYSGALTSSFVFPHCIRCFHPALLLSTPAAGGTSRPQADGGTSGPASWASPVCHPEHASGSDKVMPLRHINRYLLSELWLQDWDRRALCQSVFYHSDKSTVQCCVAQLWRQQQKTTHHTNQFLPLILVQKQSILWS